MAYQPAEPAAEQIFQTTATLLAAAAFNSGIIDLRGYTQVDTRLVADVDGVLTIEWYSDAAGTDTVRTLVIPYATSSGFQLFSAPAFTPFNRYIYTNGSVNQGDFFLEQKNLRTSLSPQILGATAFIAGGMVTQLNRSILVGTDVAGTAYSNVSVAPTTNSSGTSQNLLTVSGARPSQLPGRVAKRIVTDAVTLDTTAYTVTTGKTLFITDLVITVENTANALGQLLIRDGGVAGAIVLPIFVPDPGAGSSSVSTLSHTFAEPLSFSTDVFYDEATGTLTMSGTLIGYEE
jgi:hypothetical protein